jgi:hypothetical protein
VTFGAAVAELTSNRPADRIIERYRIGLIPELGISNSDAKDTAKA